MELCDLTAHALVDRLKLREISAVEILESTFRRIEAVEGHAPSTVPSAQPEADAKVHAYISLQREKALERARAIDAQIARGEDPGPLAGIPLSIKDIFCVEGTPSTAASKMLENFIAPYTATAVERLEAAGAIVIGKTNLDEYTFGSSSESSASQASEEGHSRAASMVRAPTAGARPSRRSASRRSVSRRSHSFRSSSRDTTSSSSGCRPRCLGILGVYQATRPAGRNGRVARLRRSG